MNTYWKSCISVATCMWEGISPYLPPLLAYKPSTSESSFFQELMKIKYFFNNYTRISLQLNKLLSIIKFIVLKIL